MLFSCTYGEKRTFYPREIFKCWQVCVHQIWCNSDHYFRSYGILKKMAHAIFFRSAAILKVLVRPNWFSNLSEPWVKESRHANFGAIEAIFLQLSWSQHKLAHSCQGRGQRSNGAINRNKHFFRSLRFLVQKLFFLSCLSVFLSTSPLKDLLFPK